MRIGRLLAKLLCRSPARSPAEAAAHPMHGHPACREITRRVNDLPAFFGALPKLLPEGTILYFEGTSVAEEVRRFLKSHSAPAAATLAPGTGWPPPEVFHVPLNVENAKALAKLAEHHAATEMFDHLHAYKEGIVLLEGHDLLYKPRVSKSIPEAVFRAFCEELGYPFEDTSDRMPEL